MAPFVAWSRSSVDAEPLMVAPTEENSELLVVGYHELGVNPVRLFPVK